MKKRTHSPLFSAKSILIRHLWVRISETIRLVDLSSKVIMAPGTLSAASVNSAFQLRGLTVALDGVRYLVKVLKGKETKKRTKCTSTPKKYITHVRVRVLLFVV